MCRANNIIHSLVMELKPRPAALVLVPTAQTVNQFIIRVKTGSSTINTCKLCVICSLGRMPKFKDHSTEGATWEFCALIKKTASQWLKLMHWTLVAEKKMGIN